MTNTLTSALEVASQGFPVFPIRLMHTLHLRQASGHHESGPSVKGESQTACEFLWGADEIGAAIGRNGRQAFHLLSHGEIKCARKVRGRWMANRAALLHEFGA
jgi:hypothetical protein